MNRLIELKKNYYNCLSFVHYWVTLRVDSMNCNARCLVDTLDNKKKQSFFYFWICERFKILQKKRSSNFSLVLNLLWHAWLQ